MSKTLLVHLAPFVLVACTSSDYGPADTQQCERLRDHLVDLQVRDIHIATGIDREAHRRAMTQALGSDIVASCAGRLTESEVECALDKSDPSAAAACSSDR
jgi:hypothetical protein